MSERFTKAESPTTTDTRLPKGRRSLKVCEVTHAVRGSETGVRESVMKRVNRSVMKWCETSGKKESDEREWLKGRAR